MKNAARFTFFVFFFLAFAGLIGCTGWSPVISGRSNSSVDTDNNGDQGDNPGNNTLPDTSPTPTQTQSNTEPVRSSIVRSHERICSRGDILLCDDFNYPSATAMMDSRVWFAGDGVDTDPGTRIVSESTAPSFFTGKQLRLQTPQHSDWQSCTASSDGPGRGADHFLCETIRADGNYHQACEGYNQVYIRFYMKFESNYFQGCFQHASGVIGCNKNQGLTDPWACFGGAGNIPNGNIVFITGIEPTSPSFPENWCPSNDFATCLTTNAAQTHVGALYFYTYSQNMDPNARWHYGDIFSPPTPFNPEKGKWYAIEMMIKVNTITGGVANADGEQAYWVDGMKYAHFKNIKFRLNPDVLVYRFRLSNFIHYSPRPTETPNTVYFSNLVISTNYIGPIN